MIERSKIADMVKASLPDLAEEVVQRIVQDIVKDGESVIYSLIRQNVAQERQQLFLRSLKNCS